jgi:ribosomal protein L40E
MRELTDSYCERCGTRYTFSPPPAKGPSLSSARLLARGLKNFVMTDGTSMDEAMAAARIDASQGESSRVTAEFHRTFNFCMTCRQYACDKCWNENQGACLSCAPLWDEEPVAPRDHLLIRTPVSRQDLDAGSGTQAIADVEMRETDPTDPVPWPAADPLFGRPAPRPRVAGNRSAEKQPIHPAEPDATTRQTPPAAPVRPVPPPTQISTPAQIPPPAQVPPVQSAPARRTLPPSQVSPPAPIPPQMQPAPRSLAEPPTTPKPVVGPARVAHPQPQLQVDEPRPLTRFAEDEKSAAQQLKAQSQAWKSADDGWSLWPVDGQPVGGEMTLTPEELQLVEAQLSHAPTRDEPEPFPIRATAPVPEPFTPTHTLAEDAARLVTPEAASQTKPPEEPMPGAWEPETPALRNATPSNFDLLGSLRQPIELPETPAGAGPRHTPVIGRLLGRRAAADDAARPSAPKEPKGPSSIKDHKSRDAKPAAPWPVPTPWVERPIERHDWWGEEDSAQVVAQPPVDAPTLETPAPFAASVFESPIQAASTPIVLTPVELEPELEPEPQSAPAAEPASHFEAGPLRPAETEPEPVPAEPSQQPLFTLPAATTDRWAAAQPDLPTQDDKASLPPLPAKRRPVEPTPIAAPNADESPQWQTVGASWLSAARSQAPWSIPVDSQMPASVVAASQSDMTESPLVAALWAESAQQVFDRGSVRVCHHCALPVSTQARYCRRCGTQQG